MNTLALNEAPELLQVSDQSKAEQIQKVFEPMVEMLRDLEAEYDSIMESTAFETTEKDAERAKALRKKIKLIRIGTEDARQAQKKESLRVGQAIDGVSNILKFAISDKEAELKKIEDYVKIAEEKRLQALQSGREKILEPFIEEDFDRPLSGMAEDVWNSYLETKKRSHQDLLNAEEDARKLKEETDRIEGEERERIALENAELKKKADAAAAETKRVQDIADAKAKKAADEVARLKQEARDKALAQAKKDKEAAEKQTARIREERAIRAKDEYLRLKKIQYDLNKGDADKMMDLAAELAVIISKYEFKSEASARIYQDIQRDVKDHIQTITLCYGKREEDCGI